MQMETKDDIYTVSASETRVPNIATLAAECEVLDKAVEKRFELVDIREAARRKSMGLLDEKK